MIDCSQCVFYADCCRNIDEFSLCVDNDWVKFKRKKVVLDENTVSGEPEYIPF